MTKYLSFVTALLLAACVSLLANVNPAAASALAKRVSPVIAANVIFEPLSGVPATEKIVYELESTPAGKLIVRGNTTVALTSGFYQFLKEFCHVQITWGAHSVPALCKAIGCTIAGRTYDSWRRNQHLIKQARELGLELMAWTVNNPEHIEWLVEQGFDYVLTDDPMMMRGVLNKRGNK